MFAVKADDFSIRFNQKGEITAVRSKGESLKLSGRGGFSMEEVLQPDGSTADLGPVSGIVRRRGSSIQFKGGVRESAIELDALIRGDRFIDIRGEVRNLSGADRALRISFTLPVSLNGWQWENTPFSIQRIWSGRKYPAGLRDVLYLDRRGEGFFDEDHAEYTIPVNKLPFTCVRKGKHGIALAYPLYEPRVFLVTGSEKGYAVTFSIGLAHETDKFPDRAGFRFIIYPVNADWGIRSAAEKYYSFFPELFEGRAERHGNYVSFKKPYKEAKWPEHAEDFGWVYAEEDFQWKNGELTEEGAAEAERQHLEVFHWRGTWYYFHEGEGSLSVDEELALLRAQAEGEKKGAHGTNNQLCGCPDHESIRGAYNSFLLNERDKLSRIFYPPGYGQWLLPMNMDPDLPKPNRATLAMDWQFRYIKRWKKPGFRGPKNFAWDALDDWGGFRRLNFRRAHFSYATVPLTFDPDTGRLCQVNGFSHWKFAKVHSAMVHRAGGLIMSNVNLEQSAMYVGQSIDVFVKERHARDYDNERLWVTRMLAGRKPVCFIGSWQPKDRRALEATTCKLLLFGIAPGARGTDSERTITRKYMPVLSRVAEAGWEPVTHARITGKGMYIERFGRKPGSLYFVAANRTKKKKSACIRIDRKISGISSETKGPDITELTKNRAVNYKVRDDHIEIRSAVAGNRAIVLSISK